MSSKLMLFAALAVACAMPIVAQQDGSLTELIEALPDSVFVNMESDSTSLLETTTEEQEKILRIAEKLDLNDFKDSVGAEFATWYKALKMIPEDRMTAIREKGEHRMLSIGSSEELEELLQQQQQWGFVKKHVVDPVKKHVVDPVFSTVVDVVESVVDKAKKAVNDLGDAIKGGWDSLTSAAKKFVEGLIESGLAWLEKKAQELINKALDAAMWDPQQYKRWMIDEQPAKDYSGTHLDNHDDYDSFNTYADKATMNSLTHAFGALPHQDKCTLKNGGWREYHPTPFSKIASLPANPFKKWPFKAQYDNDPTGYFVEPCNAISNGFFLSIFHIPELRSENNCGDQVSSADPYAMNCLDESHLLQIVTAGMPFGSWTMHGDGGSPLGGFLDTRGMFVQFYFMFRQILKAYVHDVDARKGFELPLGCTKDNVPDSQDGLSFIDPQTGERLCHLWWARQFKKLLTDKALIQNKEDTSAAQALMKGIPDMMDSIAGVVFVTLRAVFHKKFPFGQKIYETVSSGLVDALMSGASAEVLAAAKAMASGLSADSANGFMNPHDGIGPILEIFATFMDAMFWQESGKFGPGTKGIKKLTPINAGCSVMPHSIWHRKATRVIGGFIKMAGPDVAGKLVNPSSMSSMKHYIEVAASLDELAGALIDTANMFRLAAYDFNKDEGIESMANICGMITGTCAEKKKRKGHLSSLPKLLLDEINRRNPGGGWPFQNEDWPLCDANAGSCVKAGTKSGKGVPCNTGDKCNGKCSTSRDGGFPAAIVRKHSHNPHRHNPHRHNPHSHNPHSHNPHSHNPHRHNPTSTSCKGDGKQYRLGGQVATCAQLKPYCTHSSWGARISASCPRECGKCSTPSTDRRRRVSTHSHNPHSHTPHSHTPHSHTPHSHSPTPTSCKGDGKTYTLNGKTATCAQLKAYCTHSSWGARVQASCPQECGKCSTPSTDRRRRVSTHSHNPHSHTPHSHSPTPTSCKGDGKTYTLNGK